MQHVGNVPTEILLRRATEFSVDITQVKRWLTAYAKKQQENVTQVQT